MRTEMKAMRQLLARKEKMKKAMESHLKSENKSVDLIAFRRQEDAMFDVSKLDTTTEEEVDSNKTTTEDEKLKYRVNSRGD